MYGYIVLKLIVKLTDIIKIYAHMYLI